MREQLAHRSLIRGGIVFDPGTGVFEERDLYIEDGKLSDPFTPGGADGIWHIPGGLITPGWVDLHVHVFDGQDLGVNANHIGPRTGVTGMVDAGSAGAHLFPLLRRQIQESIPHLRAFLNISSIGTTSILLAGECQQRAYVSATECEAVLIANLDVLTGVKVRASHNVGGENTEFAFNTARRVARAAGVPLMTHVGPPPMRMEAVLESLEPGDIVTHCFSPHTDTALVDSKRGDRILPAAAAARARGVYFDVGHGGGSFDSTRAASALRAGFLPDTISSDIHAYVDGGQTVHASSASGAKASESVFESEEGGLRRLGLPLVVNKMLALGMGLEDALLSVTSRAAEIGGFDRQTAGSLDVGVSANIAVFEIENRELTYRDSLGVAFTGTAHLRPRLTFQGGTLVFDRDARITE